jgi:hypothetical protein
VTGRQGRRHKQLLVKEESLDRTVWRTGFERGYADKRMNGVSSRLWKKCVWGGGGGSGVHKVGFVCIDVVTLVPPQDCR